MAADTTEKYWTWSEVWAYLSAELDLEGADFVTESLAMSWANEAIDEAETIIQSLYQDYFLMPDTITLIDGQADYAPPTSLYGFKIKNLIYSGPNGVYEIVRKRNQAALVESEYRTATEDRSSPYQYFILNTLPGQPKIRFDPPAYESGPYVKAWFYRQANRLSTGSDIVDLPEFVQFVIDTLRERICFKEAAGSPRHMDAKERVEKVKSRMLNTLKELAADGAAAIEADFTHYEEHN